jgi:hypothetical protein
VSLPEKNRTYFDAEKNCKVIIKGILYMNGVRKYLFTLSYGYGASEKIDRLEIHESQVTDFCERFKPLNTNPVLRVKEELKLQNVKPNILIYTIKQMEEKKENYDTLRDRLFSVMDKVVKNEVTVDQAKAVSLAAQTIINSVNSELEFRKYTKDATATKMLK